MSNDPIDFNLYGYARNNPIRFTDRTGLQIEGCGSCGPLAGSKLESETVDPAPPMPFMKPGFYLHCTYKCRNGSGEVLREVFWPCLRVPEPTPPLPRDPDSEA